MEPALETEPTFYEDVYRTDLEVWVDGIVSDERFGTCLVLSRTLFHPHGGGQKGDRGTLQLPAEEAAALGVAEALPLADTRKADGRILHVISGEVGLEAERAEPVLVGSHPYALTLDWAFRRHQMRLHSAAHLLHCFVERVLGREVAFPATSDLQPDFGLNRYDEKEMLTPEQMNDVLAQLNAFIAEGHAIRTYPDAERAGFRYWECEAWRIPCGGTHPADTREIGAVQADLSLKRGRTGMTFRVVD